MCGNTLARKPSEKTPLLALTLNGLLLRTAAELGHDTAGMSEVLVGDRAVGEALVAQAFRRYLECGILALGATRASLIRAPIALRAGTTS